MLSSDCLEPWVPGVPARARLLTQQTLLRDRCNIGYPPPASPASSRNLASFPPGGKQPTPSPPGLDKGPRPRTSAFRGRKDGRAPDLARPPCHSPAPLPGHQGRICGLAEKTRERKGSGRTQRGTREPATYFISPSSQASDTQPGMKPGSRENHRPTSRRKHSRTLASAKEKGPSFLYSSRSTL